MLSELGKKLKISKQALAQLEISEREGTISIQKLEELTQAMNCQLVYGFIPHRPLAETATDLESRQLEARRRHRTMPRPQ